MNHLKESVGTSVPQGPAPSIELSDLKVSFGKKTRPAVDGISLQIPGGQVYGLIGRNGAGKTTLLRAIAQQLNSSGTVTLDGQPIRDNEWALERIILAGPDASWPQDLPVRSVLRIAELRWPTWDQAFAEEMIQTFRIDTSKRLRAMSRGQRSAVSIILGLAAQCPITLLDEPYLGLDVQSREAFYQFLMSDLERNPRTVILSTHHLGDVARLLDQVIIIDEGKLLEFGPLETVSGRIHLVSGPSQAVSAFLEQWSAFLPVAPSSFLIKDVTSTGLRRLTLSYDPEAPEAAAAEAAAHRAGVQLKAADLEQAVLALTGKGAGDE